MRKAKRGELGHRLSISELLDNSLHRRPSTRQVSTRPMRPDPESSLATSRSAWRPLSAHQTRQSANALPAGPGNARPPSDTTLHGDQGQDEIAAVGEARSPAAVASGRPSRPPNHPMRVRTTHPDACRVGPSGSLTMHQHRPNGLTGGATSGSAQERSRGQHPARPCVGDRPRKLTGG
jgi:hypothetical protein